MLQVSPNGRYLIHQNGQPFFYLGDTAWCLFHRLNREEADLYLETRARQGFTVVQAVALAEHGGLEVPNAYGEREFVDGDVNQPNEKYFQHIDYIVNKAASLGLVVGFLPTWGDKWNKKWGVGPEIFTPENAHRYGQWLGQRYASQPLIWIIGGDRPIENAAHVDINRALAAGLRQGDGGAHLITFHPTGGRGSAEVFHHEPWLDFNMRQNGHMNVYNARYSQTRVDYDRTSIKPVLDGEPIYEGHPVNFKPDEFGYSVAYDARCALYWDLFSGACGHTYGHHSMWQFWTPARQAVNRPLLPWTEAIHAPGAVQMQWGRRLMESRPFLTRIPDDALLVPHHPGGEDIPGFVPGAGTRRLVATRDAQGSYAMVYTPLSISFKVRTHLLSAPKIKAWWYNPRHGQATLIGEFENAVERQFVPPDSGELLDWVLVLDDASRGFPTPGQSWKGCL